MKCVCEQELSNLMVLGVKGPSSFMEFHDMLLSSFVYYFLHVRFISFHLPPHHQLLSLYPSPCFYCLLFSNLTVPLPTHFEEDKHHSKSMCCILKIFFSLFFFFGHARDWFYHDIPLVHNFPQFLSQRFCAFHSLDQFLGGASVALYL